MADTNYIDGTTVVNASWLNDINDFYYTTLSAPASSTDVRNAISAVGDIVNVGGATGTIVRDESPTGTINIKSLTGSGNISITNNTSTIDIGVDSVIAAENVGTGLGKVFKQRSGDILQFKSLAGGTNTTVVNGTDDVTINVNSVTGGTSLGSGQGRVFSGRVGDNLQFRSLSQGSNITLTETTNGITIAATGTLSGDAVDVTYDNSSSGLTATDVQAAIDEIDTTVDSHTSSIALKANSASPTFTGTVVLPSTTSIGTVSSTEIGYLDNVTSSIQTQLNAKAPISNPTFTGNITIGSASISETELEILDGATVTTTELNRLSGVTSSVQTQLDSKIEPTDYATSTIGGSVKMRVDGTTLYITNDGSDA